MLDNVLTIMVPLFASRVDSVADSELNASYRSLYAITELAEMSSDMTAEKYERIIKILLAELPLCLGEEKVIMAIFDLFPS